MYYKSAQHINSGVLRKSKFRDMFMKNSRKLPLAILFNDKAYFQWLKLLAKFESLRHSITLVAPCRITRACRSSIQT